MRFGCAPRSNCTADVSGVMTARTAAYIVLPAAVVIGATLAWLQSRGLSPFTDPFAEPRDPHRCAEIADGQPPPAADLDLGGGDTLTIGAIADARGLEGDTAANLGAARAAFRDHEVDLVIALGGIAEDADDLRRAYATLADGAPWVFLALPGDRETLADHRAALAALGDSTRVLDGAEVRVVTTGIGPVATLPGAPHASQLVAGAGGCVFEREDAHGLADWLDTGDEFSIWASYVPPRQRGARASDIVRGVHVGDPAVGEAVQSAGVDLVVHAQVDEAALGETEGTRRTDIGDRVTVGAGPAEALPVYGETGRVASGSALVLHVTPPRIEWERIDLASDRPLSPDLPRAYSDWQDSGH